MQMDNNKLYDTITVQETKFLYLDKFIVIMKFMNNWSAWHWISILSSKLGGVIKTAVIVLIILKRYWAMIFVYWILYIKLLKSFDSRLFWYLYCRIMIKDFIDYRPCWVWIDEIFFEFRYVFARSCSMYFVSILSKLCLVKKLWIDQNYSILVCF